MSSRGRNIDSKGEQQIAHHKTTSEHVIKAAAGSTTVQVHEQSSTVIKKTSTTTTQNIKIAKSSSQQNVRTIIQQQITVGGNVGEQSLQSKPPVQEQNKNQLQQVQITQPKITNQILSQEQIGRKTIETAYQQQLPQNNGQVLLNCQPPQNNSSGVIHQKNYSTSRYYQGTAQSNVLSPIQMTRSNAFLVPAQQRQPLSRSVVMSPPPLMQHSTVIQNQLSPIAYRTQLMALQSQPMVRSIVQYVQQPQQQTIIINEGTHQSSTEETTITTLKHEVEMWKAKYFAVNSQGNDYGFDELIAIYDQRIQIILEQNKNLIEYITQLFYTDQQKDLEISQKNNQLFKYSITNQELDQYRSKLSSQTELCDDLRAKNLQYEYIMNDARKHEIQVLELQGANKNLNHEVAIWKNKFQLMEEDRNRIMEDLRKALEKIHQSNFDTSKRGQFSQMELLEDENKKLREQINMVMQDLDSWRKKALALELQVFDLQVQVTDQNNTNKLQQKENERSNLQIAAKQQEIDKLKIDLLQSEEEHKELHHAKSAIQEKGRMIEELKKQNDQLLKDKGNLEKAQNQLNYEKNLRFELEKTLATQKYQCEQKERILQNKDAAIDNLAKKINQCEQQNTDLRAQVQVVPELELENKSQLNELESLQKRLDQKEELNQNLENQLKNLQAQLQTLRHAELDLKRAKDLLAAKEQEIQELRKRVRELEMRNHSLEQQMKIFISKEQDYARTSRANESLQSMNNQKGLELANLESENQNLKSQLGDKEELTEQLKALQRKYDQIMRANADLKSKVTQLNSSISSQQAQHEETNLKSSNIQVDLQRQSNLAQQKIADLEELKLKNQQLQQQLGVLKDQLRQKQQEATLFENLNNNQDQHIKQLEQDHLNSQQKIQELQDSLKLKGRQSISDLQGKQEDLIRLNQELLSQQQQTKQWQQRYSESDQKNSDLKNVESKYQEQQLANQKLDSLNQGYVQKISNLQIEIRDLQSQQNSVNENQDKLLQLQQIIEKLKTESSLKSKEITDLNIKLPSLLQEIQDQEKKIIKYQESSQLHKSELERVRSCYQSKFKEAEELRVRCNRLEQQVVDLKGFEQQIPKLEQKNSKLHNDVDRLQTLNKDLNDKHNLQTEQLSQQELQIRGLFQIKSNYRQLEGNYQEIVNQLNDIRLQHEKVVIALEEQTESAANLQKQLTENLRESEKQQQTILKQNEKIKDIEAKLIKDRILMDDLKDAKGYILTLDTRLRQAREQIDEMNNKVERLTTEAAQWKQKCLQLQTTITSLLVVQKEADEMRELNHELQMQLDEQKQNLQSIINEKSIMEQDYIHQIEQLKQDVESLQNDLLVIPELETEIKTFSSQVTKYKSENDRLSANKLQIEQTLSELEIRIAGYEQMEQDHNQLLIDFQNSQTDNIHLQEDLERALADAESARMSKEALDARLAMLASEIERQKHMVKVKNEKIEQLTQENQELQTVVTQLEPLEPEVERLAQQLESQNKDLEDWKKKYEEKEEECNQLTDKVYNLESKCALLSSEIERQKYKYTNLENQFNEANIKLQELQEQALLLGNYEGQLDELENKLQQADKEIETLHQTLTERTDGLNQLKADVLQLQQENNELRELDLELQKIEAILNTKDSEIEGLIKKIQELQADVERLEEIKYRYEGKIAMLSSEIERLNKKYETGQAANQQIQDQVQLMSEDLDRLEQECQNLSEENDRLRSTQIPAY